MKVTISDECHRQMRTQVANIHTGHGLQGRTTPRSMMVRARCVPDEAAKHGDSQPVGGNEKLRLLVTTLFDSPIE